MTLIDAKKHKELGLSSEDSPDRNKALSADLTCVDELHVSLQVAVDHENLVAAWVRAGPLSHLLVMLFDVLLKKKHAKKKNSHLYWRAPPSLAPDTEPGTYTTQNWFRTEKHDCTDHYRVKLQCCYH